jgi:hypothetical protein
MKHLPIAYNYLNQVVWLWVADEENKSPVVIADKKKLVKKLNSFNSQPASLLGIFAKLSASEDKMKLSQAAEHLLKQIDRFTQDDIINQL